MCYVLRITALFEYLCKETQLEHVAKERKNNGSKTENRMSRRRRINKKKNDLGATGLHSN
jgi:hypothetical protein